MGKPWIPKIQEAVVLSVHVEGEIPFVDDYPFDGEWSERVFHDDGVSEFADQIISALVNIEGALVTAVSVSWTGRGGESCSRIAGLEPGE